MDIGMATRYLPLVLCHTTYKQGNTVWVNTLRVHVAHWMVELGDEKVTRLADCTGLANPVPSLPLCQFQK